MRMGDKSVLIKTGINGGIDIYFGINILEKKNKEKKIKLEYLLKYG